MDEEALMQVMGQFMESMKPMVIERMIQLQEDPETRFATVVGDEPMVDFEKLYNGLFNSI